MIALFRDVVSINPMENNMKYPTCCEEKMKISIDTGKFLELVCARCGDIVYMKKPKPEKPQMLDD